MNKKWLLGGVGMVLLAGGGVAVWTGALPMPGALAKSQAVAFGKQDGDKKPEVPLEFAPREVVQPQPGAPAGQRGILGPAGGAADRRGARQAPRHAAGADVAEGSRVQAGQVLGRIDWPSWPAAWPSAAPASIRPAPRWRRPSAPRQQRTAGRAAVHLARRWSSRAPRWTPRVPPATAQAALDTTRVALRDGTLLAPISGIVAKRHVLPGEKLSDGAAGADHRRPGPAGTGRQRGHARGRSHEPGMAVQVQVEGVDQPVAGRIARIAPAAEPARAAIGVTIELANPMETLRAGQYAVARATLADDTERLTLPAAGGGQDLGPGSCLADRRRQAGAPRRHRWAGATSASARWRCCRG
jgi:membrane fusion protein (multidrug efflux system)